MPALPLGTLTGEQGAQDAEGPVEDAEDTGPLAHNLPARAGMPTCALRGKDSLKET